MRILTLFLALFLTLLPEGSPASGSMDGFDVCWEEVDDVEEEAVIRTSQTSQKRIQTIQRPCCPGRRPVSFLENNSLSVQFCFKRKWLRICVMRL